MNETGVGSVDELFDKRFSSGFYANKSSIFFKRIGRIKEIFQSNLGFSKLLTERAPVLQTADSKSGRIGIKKESHIAATLSSSDSLGARTQDPNIKSVVLYQLS